MSVMVKYAENGLSPREEKEADIFARDMLIFRQTKRCC